MPRIVASMADVSTDYNPCEPGVARLQIENVEAKTDNGRTTYFIKNKIVEYIEGGKAEDVNRTVTVRISAHKKDGTLNEMGLAELKRYFEVTVGDERANDPDADTDELHGQQFLGQIAIRSYQTVDSLTNTQVTRQNNEITRLAAL